MTNEIATVSFSELDTARQCPLKWKLAYLDRWSREEPDTSALGLGTLWHRLLELHYKTIQKAQVPKQDGSIRWSVSEEDLLALCQDAVCTFLHQLSEDEQRDQAAIDVLAWMYDGYLERYGVDHNWDIIEVESTAIIDLPNRDGSPSGFRLKIKIDLVVRDAKGNYWVVDHKSAGKGSTGRDLDWDDQFGLYIAAKRHMGLDVIGAYHSSALKSPNKGDLLSEGDPGWKSTMKATPLEDRFKRTPLNRTDAECRSILQDARATAKQAYREDNEHQRHTNTDSCKWKCSFKEACIYGRRTDSDENMYRSLQTTGFTQNYERH